MNREFDLLTEPWIRVMKPDKTVEEVGLRQALIGAQDYTCLAGETDPQDFAVLRLLLALMYTIFSRYDEDGNVIDPEDDGYDPIETWEQIWSSGRIPEAAVDRYFEKWGDRFHLFDDEKPFMQTKYLEEQNKPFSITNDKLIGTLFESDNKNRLFTDRLGGGRELTYSEAARWLIHIINYDDTSAKKPVAPRETWVSKLGAVYIRGDSLFETIMLNFAADSDERNDVYESRPYWENDSFDENIAGLVMSNEDKEKKLAMLERPIPNNQAELLTLRSRSILLKRENGRITGAYLSAGDFFTDNDIHIENMTVWEKSKKGIAFYPKKHNAANKAWQEFGSIADSAAGSKGNDAEHGKRIPGVVLWQQRIPKQYRKPYVNIVMVALCCENSMAHQITDMFSDSLSFHSDLLTELGSGWISQINAEIDKCSKAAAAVRYLSIDLQKACGASGNKINGDEAKMQFYDRIDRPFRLWLESIEPSSRSYEDKKKELDNELFLIAERLGYELAAQSGSNAVFGRFLKADNNEVTSSAQALNKFMGSIKNIFKKGDEKNGRQDR